MRKLLIASVGLLMVFWVSTAMANQFVGAWAAGDQNEKWVVQFNANGTFTRAVTRPGQPVYNESGTYRIQGNQMFVHAKGEDQGYYLQYRFTDANTLELFEDGKMLARMIRQSGAKPKPPVTVDRAAVNKYGQAGVAHAKKKEYAQAIPYFKKVTELDPSSSTGHELLAMCYRASKRYPDALASYNRAIELDPNKAVTHYGRAITLFTMGKGRQALADAEKAVQLDPQDKEFRELRDKLKRGLDSGATDRPRKRLPLFDASKKKHF